MFESYIRELKNVRQLKAESRHAASQLLEMHEHVLSLDKPTVIELGVDRGQSTKVFLNSIKSKSDALLVSVDIRDCSSVSNSKQWRFIQSDSLNIDEILCQAPEIKHGVDLVYVDSLHNPEHVKKEIYSYFKFLKVGGIMFFDDVESLPYMRFQRKDNFHMEISNRKIRDLLVSIFHENSEALKLEIAYGSTGLAKLTKLSETSLRLPSERLIERKNTFFWKLVEKIRSRKQYKHSLENVESFLIDVTKFKQ